MSKDIKIDELIRFTARGEGGSKIGDDKIEG